MSQEIGIQIALLLSAAALGLIIARWLKQPVVLGEILIGVILGPSLLNIVNYDELVRILAEIGAIFLLFMVGLQCNYKSIYTGRNAAVACVGAVVPLFLGWLFARAIGMHTVEAVFVGVALSATSIAITAMVLEENNLLQKRFAKVILGAAVIDDIISLFALAVISGMHTGFSFNEMGMQALVVGLFVGGCLLLIKPVNWLIHRIDSFSSGKSHQLTIFSAMIFAFGYAGLAELAGLSGIVGAFLAGVSVDPVHLTKLKQGSTYFEMFFSAIFFVSLGILTDLHALSNVVFIVICLTVIALGSKLLGCFIPARMSGLSTKEALAVGAGMVPRGEVTMIVALIGLTNGLIPQSTYGILIVVAFITTVIAPPLLLFVLPKHRGNSF